MNFSDDRPSDREEEEDEEEEVFEDEDEVMSDASEEKDEAEQELERLVFGDAEGFKDELKNFRSGTYVVEDDEEDADDLAGIADPDVWILDIHFLVKANSKLVVYG
jgi:U3 small nucleolar RNA-associated protein 18